MKRPTILDRETEKALHFYGGGWTIGPDTQGQASFRPSTNSRKAIDRAGIDLYKCDVLIVTGAKRWRQTEGTKNRILWRPAANPTRPQHIIY